MVAQRKFRLRAHKYRRRAEACGQAQLEVEEIRGIANYCLQQWGQAARERDELHNQLMNLTIERDEAVQELDYVTRHIDAALELAEERRQAWIQDHINAMEMQDYLNDRIEEGLVEIHRLNNDRNPIPHPPPVYPDLGPQVIEADEEEDEQMNVNAAEPANEEEEEEDDPEEVQDVSNVDSDHFDE